MFISAVYLFLYIKTKILYNLLCSCYYIRADIVMSSEIMYNLIRGNIVVAYVICIWTSIIVRDLMGLLYYFLLNRTDINVMGLVYK